MVPGEQEEEEEDGGGGRGKEEIRERTMKKNSPNVRGKLGGENRRKEIGKECAPESHKGKAKVRR